MYATRVGNLRAGPAEQNITTAFGKLEQSLAQRIPYPTSRRNAASPDGDCASITCAIAEKPSPGPAFRPGFSLPPFSGGLFDESDHAGIAGALEGGFGQAG